MSEPTNLLFPLDRYYGRAGRALPIVEAIDGDSMPEPYRSLLVGDHDMTPTLQAFHGDRIHLRVVDRTNSDGVLSRLVVLVTDQESRAVEFGAIDIYLAPFPEDAREAVLGCRKPLGAILAEYGVAHLSHPKAFLRVEADEFVREALCVNESVTLYGRRNTLSTPSGDVIADILEILPP